MRRFGGVLLIGALAVALVLGVPVVAGHALFALGYRGAGAVLLHDRAWRGFTLAQRGDYLAAADAFGASPETAYDKGNALTRAGLYKPALDAYDAALQADPEDEDARFNKEIVQKILDTEATAPGRAPGMANARANADRHHGGAGNATGDTSSTGVGYTGNKEGSTNASSQGGSKVSKIGAGQQSESGQNSEKASGSAGLASGRGRSGGDLADAITAQLAINQRRYSPAFTALAIHPTTEWLETVQDDPGRFLKLQIRAEHKRREEQAERAQGDD